MEQVVYKERFVEDIPEVDGLFAEIRREFKGNADEVIPMLQRVQRALGFLPEQALLEIARLTGVSAARVFGTATFYTRFHLQPVGRNTIRVCRGTACHVRGGARILREVENLLGIKPGESTLDLEFGLETVACIGACALAPTVMINNDTHGLMTTRKIREILKDKD